MIIPDNCKFCGQNLKYLRAVTEGELWIAARRQLAFHLSGGCIPTKAEVDEYIAHMEPAAQQAVRDKWDIIRAMRRKPMLLLGAGLRFKSWKEGLLFWSVLVLALIILSYLVIASTYIRGLE